MNSEVLVTGASGLLGANLCIYLASQNISVRALVRNKSHLGLLEKHKDSIEIIEGDILDIHALENALKGVQQVYHCAAMVSFAKKDRELMKKVNVQGTANIVNLCLEIPGIRLLHVSSVATLEDKEGVLITEKSKWKNSKTVTFYAKTKYLAELEVYRGIEEGLDAVMILPSVIVGQGKPNHPFVHLFTKASTKGISWYHHGVTGYVCVHDTVQCMHLIMQKAPTGEKYILNSENLSLHSFLSMVADIYNKRCPRYKIPYLPAKFAVSIIEKLLPKHPFLNRELLRSTIKQQEYSAKKFTEEFNYTFEPIKKCLSDMKNNTI
jgi:nucleoside-diphosphate-sugar epimerase